MQIEHNNNRVFAASLIRLVVFIAALIVAWQAVRFCQGDIGAPGFDQILAIMDAALGPQRSSGPINWLAQVFHYIGGICLWVGLASLVVSVGSGAARIVEVGFKQYMAECKEAAEEASRRQKIEATRERRREQRRKAQQSKASFGFGTLVLGVIIGMFL
ncbi:hypothetical protein ACIP1U_30745 [Cupriavidus sp. NPDC089707]|uniref:hypothetical protein n=1 Tax=Cupriavidus sp. NPDC089707 TaxID=3363963 RepID=UPI003814846A